MSNPIPTSDVSDLPILHFQVWIHALPRLALCSFLGAQESWLEMLSLSFGASQTIRKTQHKCS